MTRRLLRVVLAWILAVALPLQGYAVHAMAACGPSHDPHGPHGRAIAAAADGHHHAHAMGHGASEAHEHAGTAHDASSAGSVDAKDPHPHGSAGKCAACASCCNAVAITTSVLKTEVVRSLPVFVPTVPVAHARLLIGGFDRPPRAALA